MNIAIRYGVLFAFAIFLWAVVESLVGLQDRFIRYHDYLSYFFAIPSVAILYSGIRSKEQELGVQIGFQQAFKTGVSITFVVSTLCPLVWYVFCTWINPVFLNNMLQYVVEKKGMDMQLATQRFSLSGHLLVSTVSTLVVGVVISLVVATIVAKQKHKRHIG